MPYNLAAHEFLIENGYSYKHEEESWEDVGDAENGPRLRGNPECDTYWDEKECEFVMIMANGKTFLDYYPEFPF